MRELGYLEGRDYGLEDRYADGDGSRLPLLAEELVRLKPDVILVGTTPGALAAKQATASIPIVGVNMTDPVGFGLIASEARPGTNVTGSNEELVIWEIDQVGTQFDGFTHQAIDRLLYNCVKMEQIATRSGFTKMGMEKVGTLMTRGVLIDIAGLKGVEILPIDYEITVADLEQALQKQGIRLQPADAVLIYTGWSKHWGVDNKLYTSGCPGIGVAAAEWLIKQDPMLLGADNWPVEIAPKPDKAVSLPVDNIALTGNGVHLFENVVLDELAEARA